MIVKRVVNECTVHAPSDFASLLVTPPDRSEIGLVVQEPGINERLLVRVSRLNVDLATTGWVFQVLEPSHRET
jgi:hypothetical protein